MKTKMKKILYSIIWVLFGFILFSGLSFAKVEVDIWDGWNIDNFWDWLTKSTASIDWRIDTNLSTWYKWETAWNIILKISSVVFSVLIVVGVLVAMVGLYQILTSSDESKIKTWTSTLIYWVIGIILMYSAQYLTKVIFNNLFNWWAGNEIKVQQLIENLYGNVMFPFIKIAIYLSLWILVVIMMIRVFTYITSTDEWTKKKSLGVILRTTVWMLIISWAKQVVEAVYWKQNEVLSWLSSTNLSTIWSQILNPSEIPIVFNIINRALGLVAFVLLALIIFQTYKLLTKPDDAATFTSLKKTIIYALIGLLLIWSAYMLSNLFIIG